MLYIVSNRLPVTVVEDKVDYQFMPSSGGLVSGLSSYLQSLTERGGTHTWVGWPGATIKDTHKHELKEKLLSDLHAYPVFLSEKEMDKFYFGFCNRTIWHLFHYLPSYAAYDADYWDSKGLPDRQARRQWRTEKRPEPSGAEPARSETESPDSSVTNAGNPDKIGAQPPVNKGGKEPGAESIEENRGS